MTINKLLEEIEACSEEEQEMLADILNRRMIERRRSSLRQRAEDAYKNYEEGKTQEGTHAELLGD